MSKTTDTDSPATKAAAMPKTAPQPRPGRMAREPKPDVVVPKGAHPDAKPPTASEPEAMRGPSKIAAVIALLERPQGATLAEMVAATSWLPHTTRAALTGLKKKGRVITKDKRGDVTCYCIGAAG